MELIMRKRLINILSNQSVVVFTGAGISFDAPTCLPLGGQLVDTVMKALITPEIRDSLKDQSLRPEVMMQVLWEYSGEALFESMFVLSHRPPNRIHTLLEFLHAHGNIDRIVTTNLDLCHESVGAYDNLSHILHLHGTANNKGSIMYALDQVSDRRATEVGDSLNILLNDSTVVFLGYSGRDDFDISPALRNLPTNVNFIWIDHDASMENWKVSHNFIECDAHFLLNVRPKETVFYVIGNTWSFLKDWASIKGADESLERIETTLNPLSFDSVTIRKEVLQSISEPLEKLPDEIARLVVAEFLFRFLNRSEEAERLIKPIDPVKIPDDRTASFYRVLGYVKYRCGKLLEAEKAFQQCLNSGGRSGLILRCLADIAYRRNNFQLAEEIIKQAIKDAEVDSKRGIRDKGQTLNSYGLLLQDTGRRDEAIEAYKEAEKLLREDGDLYGVSDIANNKGVLFMDKLNLKDAEREFHESLRLRKLINHVQGICYAYLNIGLVKRIDFCMNGHPSSYEAANEFFTKALEVLPSDSAALDRALIKKNIGDLQLDNLRLSKAEKYLIQAYETFSSLEGQEGYEFSCLLSLLELRLLCSNVKEIPNLLSQLKLLSTKNQLHEKISWYLQLNKGILEGFRNPEVENLHPTYANRYRQLLRVQASVDGKD